MSRAQQSERKGTALDDPMVLSGLPDGATERRRAVGGHQVASPNLGLAPAHRGRRERDLDHHRDPEGSPSSLVTSMSTLTPEKSLRNRQHLLTEPSDYLITNNPLFHRQFRPIEISKIRKEVSNGTNP